MVVTKVEEKETSWDGLRVGMWGGRAGEKRVALWAQLWGVQWVEEWVGSSDESSAGRSAVEMGKR